MNILRPFRGVVRSKLAAIILLCLLLIVIITNIYFISIIVEDKTKKPLPDSTSKVNFRFNDVFRVFLFCFADNSPCCNNQRQRLADSQGRTQEGGLRKEALHPPECIHPGGPEDPPPPQGAAHPLPRNQRFPSRGSASNILRSYSVQRVEARRSLEPGRKSKFIFSIIH